LKFGKADLKQFSRGGVFCGGSGPLAVVGSGSVTGIPTIDGLLPLALVAGGFVSAGAWMFRRWGRPAGQAALEKDSPQPAPRQKKDVLATT
jgi:hypothetical protein